MKVKKIFLALLIIGIGLVSCQKDDDSIPNTPTSPTIPNNNDTTGNGTGGGNTPKPSTIGQLTSTVWIMKVVTLNGASITSTGTDEYEWKKDGTHQDSRDQNGSWKHSGQYKFTTSDSTAFTMFTSAVNEQLWEITSLKKDTMEIDYYNARSGQFHFTFIPE